MSSYLPVWSTCQRAKSVPTSRFYVPMCQRAKDMLIFQLSVPTFQGVSIFQVGVPTWQKACHFVQLRVPKGVPTFQLFFKRIIFFIFFIFLRIISVPNIFIYFVHLNYIPSIYILYIFFYLNLYTVCKKPMVQKYTSCKLITKLLCRSSRSQMCFKIGFLTNFEIFIGKHLYWILFLINLQATLLKRDSDTGVFL